MRKVLITFVAALLVCGLALAHQKAAKEKTTESKISGDIMAIDEAKSTITVKKGSEMHVVTFNESTKWTKQVGGKVVDAKRDEFKVGSRVICMVTVGEGKMTARRIDLRAPKF